ncbi:MFS transporter [Pedobacter caeni]|uniref:Predicted arabinose efflux permease, MFS family n=1 Tax=Pedobacter caeni TaxID=288992 RepID=A0A1M5L5A9_9SPHI|nr:MFS transporter [Pedobacter caeni]SHG60125.1 Predicted arabinose efflux permease, MFS family [Pedobacter caeni]
MTTEKENKSTGFLPPLMVLLFAVAAGLSVANVYYAQPMLQLMTEEFGIPKGSAGMIVTITQIGYGIGLLLIVPLGDVLNRRKLISGQMLLSVVALMLIGFAQHQLVFFTGMMLLGLLAVVTQVLVAYSANLAGPSERGRVVGLVTSGIVIGILLARTISGTMADLAGWRSVYFLSAVLTLILAGTLFKVLPAEDQNRTFTSYPKLLLSMFRLFITERMLLVRSLIAMFLFAAFSTLWTALVFPLSAAPFFLSSTEVGLFGLVGVLGTLGATKAGQLADRGLAQWTTGVALSLLLLSWLAIAFVGSSLWLLILGIIILDLAVQAVHVTNQSIIYTLQPEAKSRIVAGYMIFYSIGSGIGSITATKLFAIAGWTGVCIIGAAFSALAIFFWALTLRYSSKLRP